MQNTSPVVSGNTLKRLWHRYYYSLLALLCFTLITLFISLPVIMQPSTLLYGAGDAHFHVWMTWWRKYTFLHHLSYGFFSLSEAPFGTDNPLWILNPVLYLVQAGVALVFGEVVAYNIVALSAHVLSGFLTYHLARQFLKSQIACFFAGLVFAFSGFAIEHALYNLDLAQQWIIPLYLLALLSLHRKPAVGSALVLAVIFALACYLQTYFAYYVALASILFALLETLSRIRTQGWNIRVHLRPLSYYVLAAVVSLALYSPVLIGGLSQLYGASDNPMRPTNTVRREEVWFWAGSARPWSFLIPPESHPIMGGIGRALYARVRSLPGDYSPPILDERYPYLGSAWFLDSISGVSNELYLGYTNILLAGLAVWAMRKNSRFVAATEKLFTSTPAGLVRLFLPLFILGVAFSLPPFLPLVPKTSGAFWSSIHQIVIPTPTLLTMTFANPLRAPAHIAPLIVVSLAMLSAYGLTLVAQSRVRFVGLPVVLLAFAFEFWYKPEFSPLATPPEYLWLESLPSGTIITTYPSNRINTSYQRIHELPVTDAVNTFDANQIWDRIVWVEEMGLKPMTDPITISKLAALGSEYLIHEGELDPVPRGLVPVFSSSSGTVFEITAEPARLIILSTNTGEMWQSHADWTWSGEDSYLVYVWNPLDYPIDARITLDGEQLPVDATVLAYRSLTPHPRQVYIGGLLVDNEKIPPEYPSQPVIGTLGQGHIAFQSITFQPGETRLDLQWGQMVDARSLPVIQVTIEPLK